MNEIPLFTISQIPQDQIESLTTSLSLSSIKIQKSPNRVLGADDIVLLATIVSGVAASAQLIDYTIKGGKVFIDWVKQLRDKGIKPQGKLKHPKLPDIDFSTATAEEIGAWFEELEKWVSQQ